MTSWSFEHGPEARAALRSIVSDPAYGATALSNVRVMSEVLPQLLRGARLERSVLVTAAKESLASTMLRHVSDGMDPVLAVRLSANFLAAISAVPIEACYWVAAELALAVGLISAEQADELGSVPAPGRDDPSVPRETPASRDARADSELAGQQWEAPPTMIGSRPRDLDDDRKAATAERPGDGESAGQHPAAPALPTVTPVPTGPGVPTGPAEPTGQPPAGAQLGPRPVLGAPWPPIDYALPGYGGRQPVAPPDDWISRVVRDTVHPGLLAFNPPSEMQQGRADRIEVGIARSPELREALTAGLRGRGVTEIVPVDAAPVMGVELRGSSFQINPLSPVEQLVVPLARWEFDITPLRSGSQTLTLCVSIRIDTPFHAGGRIAVPVLERDIRIRVDVVYGTRRFVASNWQWLVGTAIGLGGGIAAWLSLVH